MKPAKLFPMFLKLSDRRCLVVGAGTIAESKIASLLEAGGRVRVVAPEATPQVCSWAQSNTIEWRQRPFQPVDLDGMFLVVAATSSTQLHKRIFEEATQRGVLCNIVDVPPLCDFYYPAVVQRGALQIAISTAGQSPALAQRLRGRQRGSLGSFPPKSPPIETLRLSFPLLPQPAHFLSLAIQNFDSQNAFFRDFTGQPQC